MNERKELSLEDKVAFGEKHVDELVELLRDGFLASFMDWASDTVVIENRGSEELSIVLNGFGFSIDLIETELKSIARTIVVPA